MVAPARPRPSSAPRLGATPGERLVPKAPTGPPPQRFQPSRSGGHAAAPPHSSDDDWGEEEEAEWMEEEEEPEPHGFEEFIDEEELPDDWEDACDEEDDDEPVEPLRMSAKAMPAKPVSRPTPTPSRRMPSFPAPGARRPAPAPARAPPVPARAPPVPARAPPAPTRTRPTPAPTRATPTPARPAPARPVQKARPQAPQGRPGWHAGPPAQPAAPWQAQRSAPASASGASSALAWKAPSSSPFKRVFLEPQEVFDDEDIQTLREMLQVEVEGHAPFKPIDDFEELEDVLPDYTFKALQGMGITEPMPIQAQALPIILGGHDLIGIAKTGSGKTLAFLLPAIPHMEAQSKVARGTVSPIVLILAPTRELAIQISQEAEKILVGSAAGSHAPTGLIAQCAYGGGKRAQQLQDMQQRGCHVLVGTPGRLTDFIEAGDVKLHRVTYFVLDEADRMLDLGFQSDVQGAGRRIRSDRQMLFFSATWVREVQGLATGLCNKLAGPPIKLRVGQGEEGKVVVRTDITQEVEVFDNPNWDARDKEKRDRLSEHILEVLEDPENKVLVFVNQKNLADELRDKLCAQGFKADSMHGGRGQSIRMEVLEAFKRGELQLLVATDVMGRGLDIQDITHIVIYDMCDIDDYVHRIGRTARGAGVQHGHTLTFFEYDRRWPEMPGQLMGILEDAGQKVPEELRYIVQQVEAGELEIKRIGQKKPTNPQDNKRKSLSLDGTAVAAEVWAKARKKAKPCGFFGSMAGCSNGDKCEFSHEDPTVTAVCTNFEAGKCTYGETCSFRHPGYGPAVRAASVAQGFCRYFGSAGGCSVGDECKYSHANPLSVAVCNAWENGLTCSYGDTCAFRHPGKSEP